MRSARHLPTPLRRGGRLAASAVAVAVAAVVVSGCGGSGGNSADLERAPATTFRALVLQREVVRPDLLRVRLQVRNTGLDAATPSCSVVGRDSGGTHTVSGVIAAEDPIEPGSQVGLRIDLVASRSGAATIGALDVRCT